jgi:hydrogenase large subunit
VAAALALDAACGVTGDTPERTHARLFRNLVHGACYLESHMLHFYLLSLPDYITGLPMAPWTPGWDVGGRLDKAIITRFRTNYLKAIEVRRKAHEMGAIYGGKLPHSPGYLAGGFTAVSSTDDKTLFTNYLNELIGFIQNTYLPDCEVLASLYGDYFQIGKGWGNLISFGVFEQDNTANPALLLQRGRVVSGTAGVQSVDPALVTEQVTYSWYNDSENNKHPSVEDTIPVSPKGDAYSWLKAPRYDGQPYECGALARMVVSNQYPHSVSVMDRHRARAKEAIVLANAMRDWINAVIPYTSAYTQCPIPMAPTQVAGLTEAPRGALGHWAKIANKKIAKYQVITPTCWTVSPRDSAGKRGPLEEALIGTPVANVDQPVEVLRVVHSVDPCLDCATHVMRAGAGAKVYALGAIP